MDPLLGWFAAEVLGPEVASRAYDLLRSTNWRSRLEAAALADLPFKVSVRRARQWLAAEATWEALANPTTESVNLLISSARGVVKPVARPWRREPTDDSLTETRAGQFVAAVIREFLPSLDPSYATAIAHVREMRELREIATDTSRILERLLDNGRFDDLLSRLPPGVDERLREVHEISSPVATQLAGLLSGEDSVAVVEMLVRSEPPWLSSGPGIAWAAVSEFAAAHRLLETAASAAELAVSAGTPRASRWLAKAASHVFPADPERARQLLDQAEEVAAEADLLVRVVRASLDQRVEEIRDLLREVPDKDPDIVTMLSFRAQAELAQDDIRAAIATLERAAGLSSRAAGVLLLAAGAWLRIATLDTRTERATALKTAATLARQARDERRKWGGPSFEATRILCMVGTLSLDWESVIRYGLEEPDGEATASEAKDTEVQSRVFEAALARGRDDLARQVARRLAEFSTDAFEVLMSEALLAADRAARLEQLRRAWSLAATDERRFRVQYLLARAGEVDLPGLASLELADPELAAVLRATALIAADDPGGAIAALRPMRHASRRVAVTLAEAYELAGDIDDAAAALQAGAERFSDPTLLQFAAEVLFKAGRLADAAEQASRAISLISDLPGPRASVRRLLVEVLMSAGDWSGAEAQCRSLLAEGSDDPSVRWALILALVQQGRFDSGWEQLSDLDLAPATELQALAWLDLHRRFAADAESVAGMLRLAESWGSNERVWAAGLMSAHEVSRDLDLPERTVRFLHRLTDEFFTAHPDSELFRRIQFDDVEELVEKLRPELAAGSDHFVELTQQVHVGRLPYGMLSAAAGRPYAEGLLRRAAGVLPLADPDQAVSASEVALAEALLDGRAVVDASFVHTMSLVPGIWEKVYGDVRSLLLTDVALHDLVEAQRNLALRTTGSMGWDPRRGKPVLSEITEAEAELLATRSTWMAHEAREKGEVVSWRRLQSFPDFELDRFGAWLTPVDLAAAEGITLLADDYMLRSLARSVEVRACGSIALMQAMVKADRLTLGEFEQALYVCRKNRAVDLPVDEAQMLALVNDDDDGRAACLLELSRPMFWVDLAVATSSLGSVLEHLTRVSAEWGLGAIRAATLGAIRATQPPVATGLAGGILGLAIVRADLPAAEAVRASREVLRDELGDDAADPLQTAVWRILAALAHLEGPAAASQVVLKRFASLDDTDKRQLMEVLLRGDWAEA